MASPARHAPGIGTAGMFGFKVITQYEQGIVFRWAGRCLASARPG